MKNQVLHERQRPRRNRTEREALVDLWQRSNEDLGAFCDKHDISLDSFARWRAEIGATNRGSAAPEASRVLTQAWGRQERRPPFVELQASNSALLGSGASSSSMAEVVLTAGGGLRLELRGDAARRTVEQIVAMLGGES